MLITNSQKQLRFNIGFDRLNRLRATHTTKATEVNEGNPAFE